MKGKRFNRRHINPFVCPQKENTPREPHRSSRGQRAGSGSAGLVYWKNTSRRKTAIFKSTHFSDGDEIALGYKGGYDLILMDIEMTFMDGMSAAEEIRRANRRGVIIIFITNSPRICHQGVRGAGAGLYITADRVPALLCQRMNHVRRAVWDDAGSISSRYPARAACRSSMSPTFIM